MVFFFGANDHARIVARRQEKSAVLGITKEFQHRVSQLDGFLQPLRIEVGLVQVHKPVGEKDVIIHTAGTVGVRQESAVAVLVGQQSRSGALGGMKIIIGRRAGRFADRRQRLGGPGQGGDHQSVPTSEDLFVAERADPFRPGSEQLGAAIGENLGHRRCGCERVWRLGQPTAQRENIEAMPQLPSASSHSIDRRSPPGSHREELVDFRPSPNVEFASNTMSRSRG